MSDVEGMGVAREPSWHSLSFLERWELLGTTLGSHLIPDEDACGAGTAGLYLKRYHAAAAGAPADGHAVDMSIDMSPAGSWLMRRRCDEASAG